MLAANAAKPGDVVGPSEKLAALLAELSDSNPAACVSFAMHTSSEGVTAASY